MAKNKNKKDDSNEQLDVGEQLDLIDVMNTLKAKLQGKKTYVIAAVLIAIVVAENILGVDIPNIDTTTNLFLFFAIAGLLVF